MIVEVEVFTSAKQIHQRANQTTYRKENRFYKLNIDKSILSNRSVLKSLNKTNIKTQIYNFIVLIIIREADV